LIPERVGDQDVIEALLAEEDGLQRVVRHHPLELWTGGKDAPQHVNAAHGLGGDAYPSIAGALPDSLDILVEIV